MEETKNKTVDEEYKRIAETLLVRRGTRFTEQDFEHMAEMISRDEDKILEAYARFYGPEVSVKTELGAGMERQDDMAAQILGAAGPQGALYSCVMVGSGKYSEDCKLAANAAFDLHSIILDRRDSDPERLASDIRRYAKTPHLTSIEISAQRFQTVMESDLPDKEKQNLVQMMLGRKTQSVREGAEPVRTIYHQWSGKESAVYAPKDIEGTFRNGSAQTAKLLISEYQKRKQELGEHTMDSVNVSAFCNDNLHSAMGAIRHSDMTREQKDKISQRFVGAVFSGAVQTPNVVFENYKPLSFREAAEQAERAELAESCAAFWPKRYCIATEEQPAELKNVSHEELLSIAAEAVQKEKALSELSTEEKTNLAEHIVQGAEKICKNPEICYSNEDVLKSQLSDIHDHIRPSRSMAPIKGIFYDIASGEHKKKETKELARKHGASTYELLGAAIDCIETETRLKDLAKAGKRDPQAFEKSCLEKKLELEIESDERHLGNCLHHFPPKALKNQLENITKMRMELAGLRGEDITKAQTRDEVRRDVQWEYHLDKQNHAIRYEEVVKQAYSALENATDISDPELAKKVSDLMYEANEEYKAAIIPDQRYTIVYRPDRKPVCGTYDSERNKTWFQTESDITGRKADAVRSYVESVWRGKLSFERIPTPQETVLQTMAKINIWNLQTVDLNYKKATEYRVPSTREDAARLLSNILSSEAKTMEAVGNTLNLNMGLGVFPKDKTRDYGALCGELWQEAQSCRDAALLYQEIADTGHCSHPDFESMTLQDMQEIIKNFNVDERPFSFMYGPADVILETAVQYTNEPLKYEKDTPAFSAALLRDVLVYEENGGDHETAEQMKAVLEELKAGEISPEGLKTILEHAEEFPNIAGCFSNEEMPYDILNGELSVGEVLEIITVSSTEATPREAESAVRYAGGEKAALRDLKKEYDTASFNLKTASAVLDCFELGLLKDIPEAQGLEPKAAAAVRSCKELMQEAALDINMEVGNPEDERWVYNLSRSGQSGADEQSHGENEKPEDEIGDD